MPVSTTSTTCRHCAFTAKNRAGYLSHMRKHETMAMEADDDSTSMTIPVAPSVPVEEHDEDASLDNASSHKQTHGGEHVCKDCQSLPMGSVELVSLLLVLVFALSAVLLTSIYVIETRM